MSTSPRYRRSTSVLTRAFADEVILAASDREDFDLLSGTAAVVWSLFDVPRSVEELVPILSELYGTTPESIAPDLGPLLGQLLDRGWLLEVRAETGDGASGEDHG